MATTLEKDHEQTGQICLKVFLHKLKTIQTTHMAQDRKLQFPPTYKEIIHMEVTDSQIERYVDRKIARCPKQVGRFIDTLIDQSIDNIYTESQMPKIGRQGRYIDSSINRQIDVQTERQMPKIGRQIY